MCSGHEEPGSTSPTPVHFLQPYIASLFLCVREQRDLCSSPLGSENPRSFSVYCFFSPPMMTPGHCAMLLSPLKSILLPKHLHPQGRWHFHNACSKDDYRLANDPVIARRMVLATTALMGHGPLSALLTCTERSINRNKTVQGLT